MQLSELMDDSIDQCKSVDIEIQWQLPSTIFFSFRLVFRIMGLFLQTSHFTLKVV